MSKPDPSSAISAVCRHRYFGQVADHLIGQISAASPESIIVVVGASQSGKSTVARYARARLLDTYKKQMEEDPSLVPYTRAELIWERRVGVNFRELYATLLENLVQPVATVASAASCHGSTTAGYRLQLAAVCRSRKTKTIFIDEAQQLCKCPSKSAVENLRAIKNLAVTTKCSVVLTSTYEILEAIPIEPEIEGRVWVVHLPTYETTISQAVDHWAKLVGWCQPKIADRFPGIILEPHAKDYLDRCNGRVGALMRALNRAIATVPAQAEASEVIAAIDRSLPTHARRLRLQSEDARGKELLGAIIDNDWRGIFDPRFWNESTSTGK